MLVFHANPLPMSIISLRDHRHLEVNDAAVRHSGYSREEMLGQTKPELGFWVTAEQRDRLLRLLHTEGRVARLRGHVPDAGRRGAPAPGQLGGHHLRGRARGAERVARHHRAQAARDAGESLARREPGQGRVPGHARPRAAQPARHAHQRGGGARAAAGRRDHAPRGRDHRAPDRAPRPAGGRSARRRPRDARARSSCSAGRWSCARLAGRCLDALAQAGRHRAAHGRRRGRGRATSTATPRGSSRC